MTKSLLNNGLGYPNKRLYQMETWKDIRGFDGYQVSDKGRVRSLNKVTNTERHGARHWKDRILKQKISRLDGRARVCLWENGKEHTLLVHRIMATTFLGEPNDPKMTVNHIDGNPLNNILENIEWVSRADNIRYAFMNGQYSCAKPTVLTDQNGNETKFYSMAECGRFLGRSGGYISRKLKQNDMVVKDRDKNTYRLYVAR